jgi:hypothetical protein
MSEFELRRQLQGLRRDAEPEQDLWQSVAARIQAPQAVSRIPSRSRWPWAVAASVLLAVIALGTAKLTNQLEATDLAHAVRGTPWAVRQARAMEASYEGALRAGLGEISADQWVRTRTPAFAAADAELSAAADELRQAIELDPSAPHLLKLLQRTQEQRARLWRASLAG